MSKILLDDNDESLEIVAEPVRRLCSEIQLFDLCDLDRCKFKNTNFCTNDELLTRFEKIADEDACSRINISDDDLDDDELAGYGLDDVAGGDDFSDEEEDV